MHNYPKGLPRFTMTTAIFLDCWDSIYEPSLIFSPLVVSQIRVTPSLYESLTAHAQFAQVTRKMASAWKRLAGGLRAGFRFTASYGTRVSMGDERSS